MKEFNPKKIISKYLSNTATLSEEAELLKWVQSKKNQKVFKEFVKAQHLVDVIYTDNDYETEFEQFLQKIHQVKRRPRPKGIKTFLKFAAVIATISIALLFLFKEKASTDLFTQPKNEVSLQIINGEDEYIDIVSGKNIKTKNGIQLAIIEDGILDYSSHPPQSKNQELLNILTVPYGKTFIVILSDGSRVHLNSGSTLKYPTAFAENESRTVSLDGEAFFEVSKKDALPFMVNSKRGNVKVYGTAFNISSYPNDEVTEVVLVEGSIGIKADAKDGKQDEYTMITPSQMATLLPSKELIIKEVDVEKHIAWKQGDLIFENDRFENIQKILERHYNVKIVNHFSELNTYRYNGNFQNDSIEKILNTIKTHTNFSFDRKEDTITINNPKN